MKEGKVRTLTVLLIAVVLIFTAGLTYAGDLEFHGQFRINYYADTKTDNDAFNDENRAAARLRFRPTFDYIINEDVMAHLQINIGHINEGLFNQRFDTSGDPSFGLRQGYIKAKLHEQVTGVAGIVPLSDKFGDTLFSGDWDFNPLSLVFVGSINDISYRLGTGKFEEGTEGGRGSDDDHNICVLDLDYMDYGASVYYIKQDTDPLTGVDQDTTLLIYGLRGGYDLGNVNINGFLMGSAYKQENGAKGNTADKKANGYAAKLAVSIPVDKIKIGVMGIYASGDKDFLNDNEDSANSFITPMSLYDGHGYWGYTGKLTVQGPTDTGIDDPVRIDGGSYDNNNLGLGITTIQANASFPIINKVDGYVGAGYFRLNDAPDGRKKELGTDIYTQVTWYIKEWEDGGTLKLDAGVDYAMLGKGHHGAQTPGGEYKSRNITTFFSRLQMEF
jgi:hypothetical protein